MDRLVHWWCVGDAMQDDGLKAEAMRLLDEYARKGYALPLVCLL